MFTANYYLNFIFTNMKTIFISLVILLITTFSISVNAQKDPIKWGKLLPEDISLKIYSPDNKASALVLCDYGTVSVGPRTVYTRHVRIKILKDDGIAAANIEIPYKSLHYYERFYTLKGQTFNISENGKIVKSKLKYSSIKDVVIDSRHNKKVFTFPDVKVGSIIEYTYTISSLDLVRLDNWYFQNQYPTVWSEYRVYIPKRFNYLVTFQKGRALDDVEQQQYADRLQWLYNNTINTVYSKLSPNDYLLYESAKKTSKVYLARGQNLRFVMDNMPAISNIDKTQAVTDLMPKVRVHLYLADGYYPFFFRHIILASREEYEAWDNSDYYSSWYHPGFVIYWLPSWKEATDKWLNDEHLGLRIEKKIKPEIKVSSDSLSAIDSIYKFVRKNIVWDGSYNMFADRKLNVVLKKKTGSSGEINLVLIDMLKKAGFEVSPVLVRTMNLGRVENIYPEQGQFNHVIAQVVINGKASYIDATGNGNIFELPANVQFTQGWVLKENGYGWVYISNSPERNMPLQIIKEPAKMKSDVPTISNI